jgi:hypothetical protein
MIDLSNLRLAGKFTEESDQVLDAFKAKIDGIIQAEIDAAAAAKKHAEEVRKLIAAFNAKTEVQVLAPHKEEPKASIKGQSSDAVLRGIVDATAGPPEAQINAAVAINEQVDAVIRLSTAVGTVEEAWDAVAAVQQAIGDATPEQAAALIEMGNALIAQAEIAEEAAAQQQISIDAIAQGAAQLGGLMIDAAMGAKVSWDQAIKSILIGIAKAIIQAEILAAIKAIGIALNKGGVIPGASSGAVVGSGPFLAADGGVSPIRAAAGVVTAPIYAAKGSDGARAARGVPSMAVYLAGGGVAHAAGGVATHLPPVIHAAAGAVIRLSSPAALSDGGVATQPITVIRAEGGAVIYAAKGSAPSPHTPGDVFRETIYAAGGAPTTFKPRGTDTVPAMLTPGEIVLPRAVSQQLLKGQVTITAGKQAAPGSTRIIGGRLAVTPSQGRHGAPGRGGDGGRAGRPGDAGKGGVGGFSQIVIRVPKGTAAAPMAAGAVVYAAAGSPGVGGPGGDAVAFGGSASAYFAAGGVAAVVPNFAPGGIAFHAPAYAAVGLLAERSRLMPSAMLMPSFAGYEGVAASRPRGASSAFRAADSAAPSSGGNPPRTVTHEAPRIANVTINALDGQSVYRVLTQNPRALRDALDHLDDRGY